MRLGQFLTLCSCVVLLGGCEHLLYDLQAANERQQCDRALNISDRNACLARLNAMNKEVARSRSEAAAQPAFAASEPRAANDLCFRRAATQEMVCPN